MTIYDVDINRLDGSPADLHDFEGKAVLVVNVASKCGLTPQYEGLERLQERYADRGFTVLGVPCNQFLGQEPGSAEEIATFCSTTYGVTFPMTEKVEVNGDDRHPLYEQLADTPDAGGDTGDIQWNFEKFLLSPAGEVVARFEPTIGARRPRPWSAPSRPTCRAEASRRRRAAGGDAGPAVPLGYPGSRSRSRPPSRRSPGGATPRPAGSTLTHGRRTRPALSFESLGRRPRAGGRSGRPGHHLPLPHPGPHHRRRPRRA